MVAETTTDRRNLPSDDEDDHNNNNYVVEEHPDDYYSSLIIPITSGADQSQFIEIFPEEMKETSVTTLMKVLQDEQSDKSIWADAALLYMQQKQPRDSLTLLQQACELDNSIPDGTQKDAKVRLLAATGIAQLAVESASAGNATNNAKQRQAFKEEIRTLADQKFMQAGKIDTFYPMTWMGRGMHNLSMEQSDRREQAKFFFQTTLKQCGAVMPALLGLAAVLFYEGDYKGAQDKYAEVIKRFPTKSGAPARFGLGMCFYKQGQIDRAKAAFQRALDLDPENVQAMVGSAILEMAALDETQKDFSLRTEKAIKMMSMANLLDHSNAMVQNHLANHYFWKWTPMTGTVNVEQGSTIVKSTQVIPLEPGEPVRIGTKFEAYVKDDVTLEEENDADGDEAGNKYRISIPWKDASVKGLKIWKKDYERVFALAKGAYSSTTVQEIQAESLFFLARVYHVREDNDNAHKFYERACKLSPDLAPARFGLAQTLIVKGEFDEAAKQLKILLATSINATDALALLGLIECRPGTKTFEEGLGHLRKAIELDPMNPELVVLEATALQQHKSNYPKSLERYKKAVELMKRKGTSVPYNIYNNLGVLCHETKRFEEAMDMYILALKAIDDEEATAHQARLDNIGVEGGRIIHEKNKMFFSFLDSEIRAEVTGDDKKSFKLLNKTEEGDIASLPFATNDAIRIDENFVTEIVKIEAKDGSIILEVKDVYTPPEVENNENDENKEDEPKETKKEISIFVRRENGLLSIPEATTIAFNIARLHETAGETLAAIELHKAITKRNPAYVNSYLRLACISVDCGCLNECAQWLKIAAVSAPGNSEVLTLIGNLHLSLCDWKPAQKVFDGLMAQKIPSVEAYSALSMGNIYFANLHVKEDRYAKHLQYASDYYKRILQKDPLNAYAANGIGTILAEKAEIFKAKEVFNRVREVSGDTISDALLNLGHIYLAQKKHPEALQMYKSYLKRAEDGTTPITSKSRLEDIVDVLLYIAFAYFDWARHTELYNDVNAAPADERYKQAMENLQLALSKRSKKEIVLKYNLCMTKLQAANCVLQKLTRNIPRTVEEVEEALNGLEESLKIVEKMLEGKEKGEKINIRTSMLEDFLKHCRANITSAQSHLEDEKKRAEEERAEQEIRRLAAEAAAKEYALKQAIKKEEETKKQEERDQRAAAKMRKVEMLQANWNHEQRVEAEKEQRKKALRGRDIEQHDDLIIEADDNQGKNALFDDSDESIVGDAELDEEEKKKRPKPSRNELFGDSDEEDGGEKKRKRPKLSVNELFGDSDEEDDDAKKKKTKEKDSSTAKKKKKLKQSPDKAKVDSDDDDDVEFEGGKETEKEKEKPAASSKDLFGDSDDEESDEELVSSDRKRDKEESKDKEDDHQAKKKRRVVDEEDD